MKKNSLVWTGVIVVLVLIIGGFWYHRARSASAAPSNYIMGQVKYTNISKRINATGTVQLPAQYNLSFNGKTKISQINVNVGDTVKAGQVLAQLDATTVKLQVAQAQASLNQAKVKLSQLEAGSSQADLLGAQDSLTKAQVNLNSARQNLGTLQNYKNDPASLDAAIAAHTPQNQSAQGPNSELAALQDYKQIPADLDSAIQQAQNAVTTAQADYNFAQAQFNAKNTGASSSDIQSAQDQVDQAQAALSLAQAAVNDTVMTAPVDGVITSLNGKVGEYPGSEVSTPAAGGSGGSAFIVLMASSSDMQIVVPADEADIGSVKAGQAVDITLAAYPDKKFSGTVSQVAPAGQIVNNVTTFNVTITAPNTDNVMKPGMSANVSIIVAEKQNVLSVPTEAVHDVGGKKIVRLAPASASLQPENREVQIGLDDGTNAEVLQGLQQGEQVIVGTKAPKAKSSGMPFGPRG